MSRDVLALLDHLRIARADYVGYSMGAFMGAYLLGHHADRFNSMILGGIGDETEESKHEAVVIADALRARDPVRITSRLGAAYRAYVAADPDNDLEALALAALQMWPEGYPRQLGGEGLRRVRIPVLIVNGANDPYSASASALVATIPGARLVTISGTDHGSTLFDPRFRQEALAFLDK
jgi:pimeloyl-ACP methyl ester carboxylesterase